MRRHGRLRPQFSRERFVLFVFQTQEKKSVFLGVHPWAKTFPRGDAEIFKQRRRKGRKRRSAFFKLRNRMKTSYYLPKFFSLR